MNTWVVPEPSERCDTVMAVAGSLSPGFSAAMAGSFHLVMAPRKMLAAVTPSSFSLPDSMPGRLKTMVTPPITVGTCTSLAASSSFSERGASVPPKSTVLALICLMPPEEPMPW